MRILLLEDNDEIRQMLGTFLARLGYQVVSCDRGITALREALTAEERGERFDVYLLDGALPLFDGFTVAQIIRLIESVRPDARAGRLAMITGKTRTVENAHLLELINYDAYWTKPLELPVIRETLKMWEEVNYPEGSQK